MAKVSEYKVTKVYKKGENGEYEYLCSDIIDALSIAKKRKIEVYAAFVMKRRQSMETWISQISKYIYARRAALGDFVEQVDIVEKGTYINDEGVEETIVKLV